MEQKENYSMNKAIVNVKGYVNRDIIVGYIISSIYLELLNQDKIKYEEELNDFATKTVQKVNFKEELQVFSDFIKNATNDELYEFIKYTLNNIRSTQDDSSREELCDLVIRLFGELDGGPIIYDATTGKGTFLFNLVDYMESHKLLAKDIFGADVSSNNVYISRMVFLIVSAIKEIKNNIQIDLIDSMKEVSAYPHQFIYLYPPFGLRILNKFDGEESKLFNEIKWNSKLTPEWIFIDNVISKTKNTFKKIIAIVTKRALFSESDKEFRNALIKEGYLEGIIELPNGSLKNISLQPVLLLISKNNKQVKYLDASNLTKKDKFLPFMDVDKIVKEYKNNFKTLSLLEATQKENLCPSILNIKDELIPNCISLNEVAEVFTGTQYTSRNFKDDIVNEYSGYQLLTAGDLENGIINFDNLINVKPTLEKFQKYAIKKGDIIITSKTSRVKIALVDRDIKGTIIVTGGMLIIRPDFTKINPLYLKIFLTSSKGSKALRKIQKGTVIMTINARELENIQIPSISLSNQMSIARDYEKIIDKISYHETKIKELNYTLNSIIEGEEVIIDGTLDDDI